MRVLTVAGLLAVPLLRAARWLPFGIAAAVGFAIPGVPSLMSVDLQPGDLVGLLRVAAACLGVGIVFLFDDPAKPSTVTAPTSATVVTAVRALWAGAAAALWWAATLGVTVAGAADGVGDALPRGDLTLEAATFAAVGVAAAVCLWRGSARGVTGPVAAPAALLLLIGALLLPDRLALMAQVGSPAWAAAHDRWTVLLVTAVAVAALATARRPGGALFRRSGQARASRSRISSSSR
ncbi:hypothetical protein [Virgisporangium ochraceum]|uniref:Uncharacterized protein n=1 Tax=Virgisporangium ochraceum TaxID=65505 RepID=A0A8J3ZMQ7_9ACTN|nr:hypothetical protein [Virgisporangium ochraceum]GIJ67144.1 hypothetical protein Voc01_020610 [Virgisporangium ochraceum]